MKKKFSKEYLTDTLDLPWEAIETENLGESGRWTDSVRIIFRDDNQEDGTVWMTTYDQGKSEMQECRPWEYEDEVECTLVRKKSVTVEQWVEVDE